MKTILIIYHSQGGRTEQMARAAARGADEMEGARALLKHKDFFDRTKEA